MRQSALKDIDRGWLRIKTCLDDMKDAYAGIGVLQDAEPYQDGTSMVDVAFWNEFGYGVPERSFIRSTADEGTNRYTRMMRGEAGKIFSGTSTVKLSLEKAGMKGQSDVRRKIRTLNTPPNAPSTIAQKGSSNPLIDQGSLLNSINYEVRT